MVQVEFHRTPGGNGRSNTNELTRPCIKFNGPKITKEGAAAQRGCMSFDKGANRDFRPGPGPRIPVSVARILDLV